MGDGLKMGWKGKILFLLIIYFAGYATAIYSSMPSGEIQVYQKYERNLEESASALKSDEFVQTFNAGVHKCLEIARDAGLHAARVIKQKIQERQMATDS